ncbi:MAG: Do family serine endopeptidase [Planctomycetes bacterium]|jgi:serine protease Do|nr:Do family serine endopeptidase [Planctomycetota bacterium]
MGTSAESEIRISRPRLVTSAVFVLLLTLPLSAWGEDEQSIAALRRMGKAFASIAEKTSPAVVGIRATRTARPDSSLRERSRGEEGPTEEDLFEYFFRRRTPRRYQQPEPREVAQGSGFLVTADGFILTNNHLVGEAQEIAVQLGDGRKFTGKLIGTDPETDVAVVRITAENLPYVELADSDKLEVGEWVIAIGNPLGLSHTVTAGIVSAKGRQGMGVSYYEDFIQTDAAINFGNSGGPLLNLDAQAVGINTAIIGPGGNIGIGLAIPISMAKGVYEQLKESGKVVRGYLGVEIDNLEAGMGEFFGATNGKGAVVMKVRADSPAAKAGIRADDIIVEVEGEPVATAYDLMNRIAMRKPGSKVHLVILREGERRNLTLTLDTRPQDEEVAGAGTVKTENPLGLSVQALTRDMADRLGYEDTTGVVVREVEAGSPADENGIEPGMLILEVNREPVRSVRQFNQAVAKAKDKGKILLRIRSEDWTKLVLIPLASP